MNRDFYTGFEGEPEIAIEHQPPGGSSSSIRTWAGGATRWARVLVLGTAVTFAGTGNWIACTGMGEARILDAGTGESLSEFDIGPVTVTAVARSSDDRLLATGDGNGFVTVWDTGTGSRLCELKALPAHAGFPDITALAFLDES